MANTLFLKSPKRIEALMAIMTLCLLVCKPPINPSSHRVQNGRFEQSSVLTQLGRLTSTEKKFELLAK
jgi:hypothetical protein